MNFIYTMAAPCILWGGWRFWSYVLFGLIEYSPVAASHPPQKSVSLRTLKPLCMKLLNPLFDTVFKYLMEDIEVAKSIIQAVIKQEVLELSPSPLDSTDISIKLKYAQLEMQRQDYVAIIKTANPVTGAPEVEKVVIEVQKSPFIPEIGRFRNYLADKYRRKSVYHLDGEQKEYYLPIKTIYLVEEIFNPALPAVLGRRGQYFDELENTLYLGGRDKVVELFSHDAWFIQTELLPPEFKDELMYVLSVFAPSFRTSKTDRYIDVPDNDLLVKKHKILERMIRRLEAATKDKEVNTAVDLEMEYEGFIERNIAEAKLARQNEAEAKHNEAVALALAEKERTEKEFALAEKEKERTEKEKNRTALVNMVKRLKSKGFTDEEIAEDTGLSQDEIRVIIL